MDVTLFLASIWGPVLLAVGLGIFVSRSYYAQIYRDLEKDVLAVLLFGMTYFAAGIVQVQAHNVWGTFPEVVITLLGWGLLIKGAVFIVIPRIADRGGDWFASRKLLSVVGAALLIGGGYLSWISYLA